MVEINDAILLLHPAIAVLFVLPLIGMVINLAWQTRQRRLQNAGGGKSKISPVVGSEHKRLGNWLTGAVVGIALLGIAHPLIKNILINQLWIKEPFQVLFIVLLFAATIASLFFLYRAQQRLWRGVFATLTGAGLIVLGCQDGVFRRTNEWYVSHYYRVTEGTNKGLGNCRRDRFVCRSRCNAGSSELVGYDGSGRFRHTQKIETGVGFK